MSTKKKTQKIESMSIEQFKTFIKGLSFFDENWTPNKEQWEHIKLLIDNLKVESVVQSIMAPHQNREIGNLPNDPYQGESFTESVDPRVRQSNFLGGRQSAFTDSQRRPTAVNPNITERIGNETILPSAIGQQSDFV